MAKKGPVPSLPVSEVDALLKGTTPLALCGHEYNIVFDMQAVGIIIAQTKHNVFVSGLQMDWLLDPKNMKATLDGVLQRYHADDKPTWKEIEAYITPENIQIIALTLHKAAQPAQPSIEQLERLGFKINVDAPKQVEEKEDAETNADPTEMPESSTSGSGASDEAVYG